MERRRAWALPWLMLSPFLILVSLFFLLPALLTVGMAFMEMNYTLSGAFIGLRNFTNILHDPLIWAVVERTATFVTISLLFNVGLALLLALLTTYWVETPWVSILFRAIWILPRITPPVLFALLWHWFFDPTAYGLLNALRGAVGLGPAVWLLEHPMAVVSLVTGLVGASFGMLVFSSAIRSIPQAYIRSARVDGATDLQVIRHIILPQLKWPIMYVTIWQTLSRLTEYQYILLMTDGGPVYGTEVWALFAYHKAFVHFQFGYGAALTVVIVVAEVVLAWGIWRLFRLHRQIKPVRIDM